MTETRLTHVDAAGHARMVDVSGKDVTARSAGAAGRVLLSAEAVAALRAGTVPKGDALAVARIAGIAGAKKTPDLIPLCHPIGLHGVSVEATVTDEGVELTAVARTADRTGVEMEALTAVAVAGLAMIDMVKAIDPAAVITDVRVEWKEGGKTGPWRRPICGRWRSPCRTGPRRVSTRTGPDRCSPTCCGRRGAPWTGRWWCRTASRSRRRCGTRFLSRMTWS
jgi:cyclic pyranopterin monophosphate synthase